jgi:hypothetical protein
MMAVCTAVAMTGEIRSKLSALQQEFMDAYTAKDANRVAATYTTNGKAMPAGQHSAANTISSSHEAQRTHLFALSISVSCLQGLRSSKAAPPSLLCSGE